MPFLLDIIGVAGIVLVGYVVFIFSRDAKKQTEQFSAQLRASEEHLHQMSTLLFQQMNELTTQVNGRLREGTDAMRQSTELFHTRMHSIGAEITKVSEIAKDISSLKDILSVPKMRGGLGELMLSQLLSEILPHEHFEEQYTFHTGETVDAVIRFKDRLVAIDSKFPLEDFARLTAAETEEEKAGFRKSFLRSMKSRIDEIAKKYILPDEKTLEIAFMYIPSEHIYYEFIVRGEDDISEYAFKKHVIPVSPSTLYSYLQIVLIGLRGMQIEQQTQEILNHLSRLRDDYYKFEEPFLKMGKHLAHLRSAYEDSEKRLQRFSDKLLSIEQGHVRNLEDPTFAIEHAHNEDD
ncbi:MAG: DNA recombination protein RmuC [Patescibacteria group bacterium]|nr:DNA recombination protein RmuC [Patescibacteria group bacterium]MDE2438663.1 DNA recombination protein RmuC [Patescibacteria group bacterium]